MRTTGAGDSVKETTATATFVASPVKAAVMDRVAPSEQEERRRRQEEKGAAKTDAREKWCECCCTAICGTIGFVLCCWLCDDEALDCDCCDCDCDLD